MEPSDKDRVEQWLDTALQQYGEVESRVGLEGRVLANLRAEKEGLAGGWNWWPALAAIASILVVGATIFYVLAHGVAQHKIVAKYQAPVVTKSLASPNSNQMHSGYTPAVVTVSAAQGSQKLAHSARSADIVKTIAEPRLEQFPSPRPLSEQEQILANYVTQFHDKAILMARAQTKFREQQEMEFQQFSSNVANEQSSE